MDNKLAVFSSRVNQFEVQRGFINHALSFGKERIVKFKFPKILDGGFSQIAAQDS